MNTTNDKTRGVPGFQQKWWSAFMKLFQLQQETVQKMGYFTRFLQKCPMRSNPFSMFTMLVA